MFTFLRYVNIYLSGVCWWQCRSCWRTHSCGGCSAPPPDCCPICPPGSPCVAPAVICQNERHSKLDRCNMKHNRYNQHDQYVTQMKWYMLLCTSPGFSINTLGDRKFQWQFYFVTSQSKRKNILNIKRKAAMQILISKIQLVVPSYFSSHSLIN